MYAIVIDWIFIKVNFMISSSSIKDTYLKKIMPVRDIGLIGKPRWIGSFYFLIWLYSVQLKFNQYFVANTTRNSVVTLGTYEQDSKVKYYKKSPTVAWFVNDNGMISVINSEQFKNIKNYKHLTAESFSPNQGIEILRELMAYK